MRKFLKIVPIKGVHNVKAVAYGLGGPSGLVPHVGLALYGDPGWVEPLPASAAEGKDKARVIMSVEDAEAMIAALQTAVASAKERAKVA